MNNLRIGFLLLTLYTQAMCDIAKDRASKLGAKL
jgi:hypothetical protein